jgi:hypothetical protein
MTMLARLGEPWSGVAQHGVHPEGKRDPARRQDQTANPDHYEWDTYPWRMSPYQHPRNENGQRKDKRATQPENGIPAEGDFHEGQSAHPPPAWPKRNVSTISPDPPRLS